MRRLHVSHEARPNESPLNAFAMPPNRRLEAASKTIDELLINSSWRAVPLLATIDQLEIGPELRVERIRVVAGRRKARASLRSLRSERRDDEVTTRRNGVAHLLDVAPAVLRVGQEMEDRTVMPYLKVRWRQSDQRDIGRDPRDGGWARSNPIPRRVQRRGRNIHHGDIGIPGIDEVINQS